MKRTAHPDHPGPRAAFTFDWEAAWKEVQKGLPGAFLVRPTIRISDEERLVPPTDGVWGEYFSGKGKPE